MTGLDEVAVFPDGKTAGYKVTLPAEVDVKSIRMTLGMTQQAFSNAFGFSIDAVKHWEGGRRTPEASARAFLTVIARDPNAVMIALHRTPKARNKIVRTTDGKSPGRSKARIAKRAARKRAS